MASKLKPCPFCGSPDVQVDEDIIDVDGLGRYFISCDFCHTIGPSSKTKTEAIIAWNRRRTKQWQ